MNEDSHGKRITLWKPDDVESDMVQCLCAVLKIILPCKVMTNDYPNTVSITSSTIEVIEKGRS